MKEKIMLGLLALIALLSISSAKPLHQIKAVGPIEARNQRDVDFAYGILKYKKKEASEFCTTWLHLPPPKTTVITTTSTTFVTKPSQTSTVLASVTKTGDTATSTNTISIVKDEISTSFTTNIIPATTTVTVATVPSVSTYLSITTSTVTSTVPAPLKRRGNNDRTKHPKVVKHPEVPFWLKGCVNDAISKACSYFVSSTTFTSTATNTYTATKITPGVSLVTTTSTTTFTPTSVEYTSVTSTRTIPTIATAESVSTSTIQATATSLSTTSTTSTTTTTTFTTLAAATTTLARIKLIKTSDNSEMGYVGGIDNHFGTSTLVSSASDAAIFSYKYSTGFMNINSPVGSRYPYFGAVFGQDGSEPTLKDSPGGGYLNFGYVAGTAPGTQSTDTSQSTLADEGLSGVYESQIWTLDPTSKILTVTWTQGNGSPYNPNVYVIDIGVTFIEASTPNGLNGYNPTQINFVVENLL